MFNLGVSDDYASLDTGRFFFYYGYEEPVDGGWGFVVKDNKVPVARYSHAKIVEEGGRFFHEDGEEPMYYLLAGIGLWLADGGHE